MDSDATATDSAPDITTTPAPQDPAVYQNDDPAYQVFVDTLSYLEPAEIAQIIEAYRFSEAAHQGQQRLSGEPYVTHPLAVAGSLAEWRMDALFFQTKAMASSPYLPITDNSSLLLGVAFNKPSSVTIFNL